MNQTFDSVYPDLLKSGLNKLGYLDAHRELLALFSALEHFRRDLHGEERRAHHLARGDIRGEGRRRG